MLKLIQIFLIWSLAASTSFASEYKFTFHNLISEQVGYFTIPTESFESGIRDRSSIYIDVSHTKDLYFEVNNAVWTVEDINEAGWYEFVFDEQNMPKIKQSTSFLGIRGAEANILMFASPSIVLVEDQLIRGAWTTSISAIPEPPIWFLFLTAIPFLKIASIRRT